MTKTNNKSPIYHIADIHISEDGTFTIGYLGYHAEQGGETFMYARDTSSQDLNSLMLLLKRKIEESIPRYVELMEQKALLRERKDGKEEKDE